MLSHPEPKTADDRIREWRKAYVKVNGCFPPIVTFHDGMYRIHHDTRPSTRSADDMEAMTITLTQFAEAQSHVG